MSWWSSRYMIMHGGGHLGSATLDFFYFSKTSERPESDQTNERTLK